MNGNILIILFLRSLSLLLGVAVHCTSFKTLLAYTLASLLDPTYALTTSSHTILNMFRNLMHRNVVTSIGINIRVIICGHYMSFPAVVMPRSTCIGSFKSTQPQNGIETEYPIILWICSGIFLTSSIGFARN